MSAAVDTPPAAVDAAAEAQWKAAAAAMATPDRDFRAWLAAYDELRVIRGRAKWPTNAANREKHSRR